MNELYEAEVDALAAGPQVEVELDADEVAELLSSGLYEPARGMYRGEHYRAEHGNGCFHLRCRGDRAWLHLDRWDPRRHPVRHAVETPELALGGSGALVAGATAALRWLRYL